jgi:hypothetical protein
VRAYVREEEEEEEEENITLLNARVILAIEHVEKFSLTLRAAAFLPSTCTRDLL